jgi:hypothetical protein
MLLDREIGELDHPPNCPVQLEPQIIAGREIALPSRRIDTAQRPLVVSALARPINGVGVDVGRQNPDSLKRGWLELFS